MDQNFGNREPVLAGFPKDVHCTWQGGLPNWSPLLLQSFQVLSSTSPPQPARYHRAVPSGESRTHTGVSSPGCLCLLCYTGLGGTTFSVFYSWLLASLPNTRLCQWVKTIITCSFIPQHRFSPKRLFIFHKIFLAYSGI